jgi:hypothetical protein
MGNGLIMLEVQCLIRFYYSFCSLMQHDSSNKKHWFCHSEMFKTENEIGGNAKDG